jgi:hypothetical protein
MLPRRRDQIREPVEELKRREFDDAAGARPRGLPPAPRADPVGCLVSGEHVADTSDPAIFTTAPHEEPFQREGWNSSSKTPSDALAPAVIRTSAVQLTRPDAVSTRYARCLITFISEASGSSDL